MTQSAIRGKSFQKVIVDDPAYSSNYRLADDFRNEVAKAELLEEETVTISISMAKHLRSRINILEDLDNAEVDYSNPWKITSAQVLCKELADNGAATRQAVRAAFTSFRARARNVLNMAALKK